MNVDGFGKSGCIILYNGQYYEMIKLKLVNIISKLLNFLPLNWKNYLFGIVLCYFPIWLIRMIPCSYSSYLRCYLPEKGDVILDCGAHIGNCTILFSRLVGEDGLVIALEPFEESFKILKCRLDQLNRKILLLLTKVFGMLPESFH